MTNVSTFTSAQLAWARSHDWCVSASATSIQVREAWTNLRTGERGIDEQCFTSFSALRNWAGY